MKEYKILQMMSTNRNIKAIFERIGTKIPPHEVSFPVVGVALVEDMTGQQSIKSMYVGGQGLVEFLEEDEERFIELRSESRGINTKNQTNAV